MEKLFLRFPEAFLKRLEAIYPTRHISILNGLLKQHSATTFRVNTLKIDEKAFVGQAKAENVQWQRHPVVPNAYYLVAPVKREFQETALYKQGCVYLQNISSMLPVLALDVKDGDAVLDMCAAPGSKTSQITALARGARLTALEKDRVRYYKLKSNLEKLGCSGVEINLTDAVYYCKRHIGVFDKVLLDAPCSAEGRFNPNEPKTYKYWSERKIREMQKAQRRLILAGWSSLKLGGRLVYSTCTFAPEENEGIIDFLMNKVDGGEVESLAIKLENAASGLTSFSGRVYPQQLRRTVRVLPASGFSGFYIASLRKTKP